jgi:hypothetical protein
MEFLQTLRRFFAIRGQPALLMSDNGSQLVGAERVLKEMIKGWNPKELKEFGAERGKFWSGNFQRLLLLIRMDPLNP